MYKLWSITWILKLQVHRARWNGYYVVLNNLINPKYKDDFLHGLKMLINFQPDQHVTQLLGYCRNTFVTQYYPFGSAINLESLFQTGEYAKYNTINKRFQFCLHYVEIIAFLHNSPVGTRVMCDSNDLRKNIKSVPHNF